MSPPLMDLAGRRILVTGASSGIGRETSILLSGLNARLVLVGRNEERLRATLQRLQGEGHELAPFDLCATDDISRWLKSLAESSGPLGGIVHSAGIHMPIPLRVLSAARLEQIMRINTTSAFMLIKAFRQKGCCAPGGSIVLFSSVFSQVGESGISAYAASKAALCGMARSLAIELAPEGIRVNCIAAGMVRTEMMERFRDAMPPERFLEFEHKHPLGIGTARDIAHGAAFLLAETGRWITGTTLVIDGGYTAH